MTTAVSDDANRNLIVNFLPQSVTQPALQELFERFGALEECKLIYDKQLGTSKGYGFVKYFNDEDAENAIAAMHGVQLENKRLRVAKAAAGKQEMMAQREVQQHQLLQQQAPPLGAAPIHLYVAGFSEHIGVEELRQVFAPYGTVLDVRQIPSQPGKKGVAFVQFASALEATGAISGLNNTYLGADQLVVKFAERTARADPVGRAPARVRPPVRASPYPVPQRVVHHHHAHVHAPAQPHYGYAVADPLALALPLAPAPQPLHPAAPAGANLYSLFVYPVPQGLNDAYLWKLFGPYGAVTAVDLVAAKGYAFVHMPNYYEAVNAINNLNGAVLEGNSKPLQVSFKT